MLSGQGIETLRDMLADESARLAARDAAYDGAGRFRMILDRAFTLEGAGTVVTGMVLSGQVGAGDMVTISPGGEQARVRGLRAQNRAAERAGAGARVALNLAGIGKDRIRRGDVAMAPSLHAPTARADALLHWVDAKPFASGARARLHSGGADADARLVSLGAGPEGGHLVQVVLDRPLALGWGDRFILRDPSASRTLGGGRFLDLRPPARRRATPERHAALAAHALPDPARALAALLDVAPFHVDLDAFLRDRALAEAADIAGDAAMLGDAPRLAIRPARLAALTAQMAEVLAAFHEANPDLQGMGREALRLSLTPRLPRPAFAALLRQVAQAGQVLPDGSFLRLPGHAPQMGAADEALYARIAPALGGDARFRPPRVRDFAQELGEDEREIRRMLKLAARLGRVDQIARDHFFLRETTREMAAIARELSAAAEDGWFGAPAFRDRMGNGRKVAIQILDFFDRLGMTQRRGDLRRINPHRADLF